MTRPRINASHDHASRGLDAYWTPPEAVRALCAVENLPREVWDPACGNGAILAVLSDRGHAIHGSDIADYDWPGTEIEDYFVAKPRARAIVTNPPYKLAHRFLDKALSDADYVAFLLRLNFLESVGRKEFFRQSPPSRVLVSSRRLPMMHRLGWNGPKSSSNHAFGWFVWDCRVGSADTAKLVWFDWKEVI